MPCLDHRVAAERGKAIEELAMGHGDKPTPNFRRERH